MSAPLVPSPLDYIGRRKFSFYPPIAKAEPNEWLRGTGSWSEVQVVNAATGQEIWIPRQYIGGVSDGPGLRLVVELSQELCYEQGALVPRVKRVIEMPHLPETRTDKKRWKRRAGPAPVVGIKVESDTSPNLRLLGKIGLAIVAFFVLTALVLALARL